MKSKQEAVKNGWDIKTEGESKIFWTSENCMDFFHFSGPASRENEVPKIQNLTAKPTILSATFTTTGRATLNFTNCKPWWLTSGVVTVKLAGVMEGTSKSFQRATPVTFSFSPGDKLSIETDHHSIVQINSLKIAECGNFYNF